MAARVSELEDESGDVDTLLARTTRLRTWAYVAHRPDWVDRPEHWRERLAALEDRLSDALHRSLVDAFVERKGKARPPPRGRGQAHDRSRPSAHPFAALERLRKDPDPVPSPALDLDALADAPHERFVLDRRGEISAAGVPLALVSRGPSLSLPEVRLYDLALTAGARSRLQRRLLAFARDDVGRLLQAFAALRASERAPLRAVAHHLERGLGSALTEELASSLATLDVEDHALLAKLGITVGALGIYLRSLLTQAALARRALLVRVQSPELDLPVLTRVSQPAGRIAPAVWLSLGHLVVSDFALRIDLAERALAALGTGQPEREALRSLALPKRALPRVAAALRALPAHDARA